MIGLCVAPSDTFLRTESPKTFSRKRTIPNRHAKLLRYVIGLGHIWMKLSLSPITRALTKRVQATLGRMISMENGQMMKMTKETTGQKCRLMWSCQLAAHRRFVNRTTAPDLVSTESRSTVCTLAHFCIRSFGPVSFSWCISKMQAPAHPPLYFDSDAPPRLSSRASTARGSAAGSSIPSEQVRCSAGTLKQI